MLPPPMAIQYRSPGHSKECFAPIPGRNNSLLYRGILPTHLSHNNRGQNLGAPRVDGDFRRSGPRQPICQRLESPGGYRQRRRTPHPRLPAPAYPEFGEVDNAARARYPAWNRNGCPARNPGVRRRHQTLTGGMSPGKIHDDRQRLLVSSRSLPGWQCECIPLQILSRYAAITSCGSPIF